MVAAGAQGQMRGVLLQACFEFLVAVEIFADEHGGTQSEGRMRMQPGNSVIPWITF